MKKALIILLLLGIIGVFLPDNDSKETDNTKQTNTAAETTPATTKLKTEEVSDDALFVPVSRDLPTDETTAPTKAPTLKPTSTPTPKPTNTPTPKPTNTPTPKPQKLTGKLDEYEKNYRVFYVANINTKKFHYRYCRHVDRMYESNTNYATEHGFADYEDARNWLIKHGYDPCGTCNP